MRADAYEQMAEHENRHWWFVGRRAIVDGLLASLHLPPDAAIAEIGCGSGGNLGLLAQHGSVVGVEPFVEALEVARSRYPNTRLLNGSLPGLLPLPTKSFDLVALLDVLEHVEDDAAALAAVRPLLRQGGRVLLTVPAYPALFGSHDRRLHHFRRYRRGQLRSVVREAGMEIERLTAFNLLLSPPAIVIRLMEKLGLAIEDQEKMPPAAINAVLAAIFSAERHLVRHSGLRFGLSYAAVLRLARQPAG